MIQYECDCCNTKIKNNFNNLIEKGWSAFKVGNEKKYYYCNNCKECARKKMVERLSGKKTNPSLEKNE